MNDKAIQQIKQRYGIVGNSEELNRCVDVAIQVAPTDLSVLIYGESGVGKEIIPRVIHDNSARKHNHYFAINCGSLPEGTIDSELFGHKKGSFTGAVEDREGYFGVANNGTLFLDEVGELPLATQTRLLRVLETGEYIRVGESEMRKTNVRIVAATNVNMQQAIREGKFREDLYYRLNTIPIKMPPLRDRGKDIELLFRKFAYDISEKYRFEPVRLTEDARQLLLQYKWPGNIRQLRNLVEQISIINKEREITAEMLLDYGISDDSRTDTNIILHGRTRASQGVHSYDTERDMLFQLLSSIGKEVKDLKDFVYSHISPSDIHTESRYRLMGDGEREGNTHERSQTLLPHAQAYPVHPHGFEKDSSIDYSNENIQEIDAEAIEDDIIPNQDLLRKNMMEALRRNNGNRKKAAADLGISERTLYRKIKEHGFDI